MLNKSNIEEKAIDYANHFGNLQDLITYISNDSKKFPQIIQEWFYNFSYYDLNQGLLSNCLLLGEMDNIFPEKNFSSYSHEILKLGINRERISKIENPGLWTGLTGICMAIQAVSKNNTRYVSLLKECNIFLKKLIKEKLKIVKLNLNNHDVHMPDYDLIEGISGIVVYLLEAKKYDEDFEILFNESIGYLTQLCGNHSFKHLEIPNWYIPQKNQFIESEVEAFPQGNFNVGISHGITGVLAVLTFALDVCSNKKEVEKAIYFVTDWLVNNLTKNEDTSYWEKKIPLEKYFNYKSLKSDYLNFSWCYGDLSIARTIWKSGTALNNSYLKEFSLEFFNTVNKHKNNYNLISHSYCHGIAGLLHLIIIMNEDTKLPIFEEMESFFIEELIKRYDEKSKFGFKDIEEFNNEKYKFNKTGLLTGNSGIYLVLLYYIKRKSFTKWESLFLMSN